MLILAALISTLSLDGSIAADHAGDYVVVPFEVPAGTVEVSIAHRSTSAANVLDWGLWDSAGFRGWGGGLVDDAVVGQTEASRGYLPGAITAGTWYLVIGKATIVDSPAGYEVTVSFYDAETLAPRARQEHAAVVLESGSRWYRGDFHVHSRESGDASASFEDIASLARAQRLDFVALSDHNTVSQHALAAAVQADLDDLLFLRAAEVTTYGGHANAIGFTDYVDHRIGLENRTARALIDDVVGQGGIVSINHPALDLGDLCIGCAWSHADTPWDSVAAIEIHTGNYESTVGLFTPRAIALWDQTLASGHRVAAVGGSDDHRAGQGTGTNDTPIGSPTTLVYADELSEAAIIAGVRAGRTVVLLRGPDDPMVELFVTAGGERGMLGDTVMGERAVVEAHVTGGDGLDFSLVVDGTSTELVTIDGDDATLRFEIAVPEDGARVRGEVLDAFLPVTVTSHVYVAYAAEAGGCCQSGGSSGSGFALAALAALLWWRGIQSARRAA